MERERERGDEERSECEGVKARRREEELKERRGKREREGERH